MLAPSRSEGNTCLYTDDDLARFRRSVEIHFGRYRLDSAEDRLAFKSVVLTFQRHLPLAEEPDLGPTRLELMLNGAQGNWRRGAEPGRGRSPQSHGTREVVRRYFAGHV